MGETANATKKKTGFFKGIKSEFKRINWPSFETLMKQSFTVIVVSAIVGAIVALIDFLYSSGIFYVVGR